MVPEKPGFLDNMWVTTKYFHKTEKPGFLDNMWVTTKYFRKKTRFLCVSPDNFKWRDYP
jgi:hypothetical protein